MRFSDLNDFVVRSGEYVDLATYGDRFVAAAEAASRFVKTESAQTFSEPDNTSLQFFLIGDFKSAAKELCSTAFRHESVIPRVQSGLMTATRFRLVTEPLSPYLRWELSALARRSAAGEKCLVVSSTHEPEGLGELAILDDVAFVVDYDQQGLARGAWALGLSPEQVDEVANQAARISRFGEDVAVFAKRRTSLLSQYPEIADITANG